ncbi:PD-(D/E)XK nuclease family protein [bacterium]|nr:PD-(D/E)XK nuclease family protein [bacterium]
MFSHTLVLCPTAISAREARRRELDRAGRAARLGFMAMSKSEFVQTLWAWLYPEQILLAESERMALAGRLAREHASRPGDTGFSSITGHPGFWKSLLIFFDECREGLIGPDRLHELTQKADIPPRRADGLRDLFQAYQSALDRIGAADRVSAEERVLADLPSRWKEIPVFHGLEKIVIEGIVDVRPLFFEVILALARIVDVQVRLPVPPEQRRANRWLTDLYARFESLGESDVHRLDSHLSVDWEEGQALRPLLDRIFLSPVALQEEARAAKRPYETLSPEIPLKIIRAGDARAEWRAAARSIRALLDAGVPPEDIAILRRSARVEDEFLAVFDNFEIPLDVGDREEDTEAREAVRNILSVYHLIESDFAREDLLAFAARPPWDMPRAFQDPDIGLDLRQSRAIRGLKDISLQLKSQAAFIESRNPVQARRLKTLSTAVLTAFGDMSNLNAAVTASDHLDALWKLLESRSFLLDEEIGRWLAERRARLARIFDGWSDTLPCSDFSRLLEAALADRPQSRRPGGGVAMLGLGDLPGRSVNHLFILGMNAGVFPTEPIQEVLLKDAERVRMNNVAREKSGAPAPFLTAERERLRENFMFFLALLAVRKSATMSFSEKDASGKIQSPSVYIDDVLLHVAPRNRALFFIPPPTGPKDAREREIDAVRAVFSREAADPPGGVDPGRIREIVARADIERRRLAFFRQRRLEPRRRLAFEHTGRVGRAIRFEKNISVSALETFSRCAFLGFARHVLHLPETERPREAISPADLGSLIHETVCAWWKAILAGHPARPDEKAAEILLDRRADFRNLLEETAGKYMARGSAGPLWPAQARLIQRVADSLVELDVQSVEKGWWPDALEDRLVLKLSPDLDAVGRLDRLDRRADGTFRVIDYKTAQARALQSKKSKLGVTEIQMPAYALAIRQKHGGRTPVELFYYALRHRAEPVDLLKQRGRRKNLPTDVDAGKPAAEPLDELLQTFDQRLKELLAGFEIGACDVTPADPDQCGHCPCRTACGILPAVVPDGDADEADAAEDGPAS